MRLWQLGKGRRLNDRCQRERLSMVIVKLTTYQRNKNMNDEASHRYQRGYPAAQAIKADTAFCFNLRAVKDTATDHYWFVARDVCESLGTNAKDIPAILKTKDYCSLLSLRVKPTIEGINNLGDLRKDTRMISEPGLYRLICRSRKPDGCQIRGMAV